jgi:hypothetical protein
LKKGIKKSLNNTGDAEQFAALRPMYAQPLPSTRTGALYNAFSYPTKISPEAIAVFIATHTIPGSTVLDTFAGSGTTGLAAKLCDKPTAGMERLASQMGLNPIWGPRRAVLYELGAIGCFAADVMCNPPDPTLFEREATALIRDAYAELGALLEVVDDEGKSGVLRHAIWSDVLACPNCNKEHTFWDVGVLNNPLRIRNSDDLYPCPSCSKKLSLGTVKRATEDYYDDLLDRTIERRKRVLVRIHGKTGKRKWQRPPEESDLAIIRRVDLLKLPTKVPIAELKLGDLYRSGYHFGVTHLHHLYTRRNLICLATIFDLIERRDERVRRALRLLTLSYNQSHSTLMTRIVVKNGQSDFVLTGAQSGVLYISSLPVEKNILEGLKRKVKSLRDAFALICESRSEVVVRNQSSTSLVESTESVNYLFTDPPFADFIPYSEINQVNELWIGKRTDDTNEAVMSSAQGKTLTDYGRIMSAVFKEAMRVLAPDGMATVVFHAGKAEVWSTLQRAYRDAGFEVVATSVLDKLQASFKQVVSTVSVKGDPLLLLTKLAVRTVSKSPGTHCEIITELIEQARISADPAELEPTRLYSRYVNSCLESGGIVEMNADEFYARVEAAGVV